MNCLISGEFLSNLLGFLSSILWAFVIVPQMYQNYQNKSSDAISLSLILLWIVGDFLSMFSAQVKNISPIVTYVAIYHIVLGTIFLAQIIYYRHYKITNRYVEIFQDDFEYEESIASVSILTKSEQLFIVASILITTLVKLYFHFNLPGTIILADLVAWSTTFIFIGSRIPQIVLNHRRKSTTGLSVYSFIFLNIANYLFLASILVNICDSSDSIKNFMFNNVQWISGAFCTSILDAIIFYQFWVYKL
jgi:uncharacterized protein with PQ loop repeat